MENNSCIIYNNFLPPDENAAIYTHALQNKALFSHTKVGNGENEGIVDDYWRHSLSLKAVHFKEINKILVGKIEMHYPEIIEKLQIPVFEISHFEIQLTSHNHGEYFKPHIDNGKGNFKNRVITFVYYFHSVPKMFTGGQLLFLNNKPKPLIVEPDNNTVVFFNSSVLHAVHPVLCPSKKFEHGRFTLNGWIRKTDDLT